MSEPMTDAERQALRDSTDALTAANKELKTDLELKTSHSAAETENARLRGEIAVQDSDDADVIREREARAALEAEGQRTT